MCVEVRKVLAKYYEVPEEYSYGEAKPWIDYLKDREDTPSNPETVDEMMQDTPGEDTTLDKPFSQYNPYDYDSPSDKPKDQKGGPPLVNTMEPKLDYGLFQTTDMYKDNGPLEEWWKARREDFTTDEDEQEPAISLTRHKCAFNVIQRYLGLRAKTAATLDEVVRADTHYKNVQPTTGELTKFQRARQCSITYQNDKDTEKRNAGYFEYKVTSPGSPSTYTVYFQFVKPDLSAGGGTQKSISYAQYPVKMACTCPSFLYYGAQHYAMDGKYMFDPAIRRPQAAPHDQNWHTPPKVSKRYHLHGRRHPGRGLNFRVCKHILKCYLELKNFKIEVPFEKFPVDVPPSKIINKEEWKRLMKQEFSEEVIKKNLKSPHPVIPAFFNRENITPGITEWFYNIWMPRSDEEKIKVLKTMSMFPERVYFTLLKEAYLKRSQNQHISDRLINEGYDMMAKVIKPESEMTPEQAEMEGVPEEEKTVGQGMGFAPPGGNIHAGKFIQGVVEERVPGQDKDEVGENPEETEREEGPGKRKPWQETLKERTEKRKQEREKRFGPKPKGMIRTGPGGTVSPLEVVKRFQASS